MKKITLLLLIAVAFSCKKTTMPEPDPLTTPEYNFDKSSNSDLMFQDGESVALLTSDDRCYEIGKVLRVKALSATTIEVANFAPVDIADATILLTVSGSEKPIKLFKIGKIRAHAVSVIEYPFIKGGAKFLDTENREVDMA